MNNKNIESAISSIDEFMIFIDTKAIAELTLWQLLEIEISLSNLDKYRLLTNDGIKLLGIVREFKKTAIAPNK